MNEDRSLEEIKKEWHGTLKAYVIGFIACILLTVASFYLVWAHLFTVQTLIYTIVGLGIIQALVQLIFFLHIGNEPKPRWETLVFLFMVLVLIIVVIGSLWIMHDLNNRVMPQM